MGVITSSIPGHTGQTELGEGVVAASSAMQKVCAQVRQIANVEIPVLLLGESGTGKEVIARMIHKQSQRAQWTFMRVNCAALPAELLESELFGHEAGAFTGATQTRPGKFEACQHGTIFLDEIAEMPTKSQAKFLHVLQDGEFSRLGNAYPQKVDVRVLAATNVNLQQAIASRQFRVDLYYRLNIYSIRLPPLRERRADIVPMIDHFTRIWAGDFGRQQLPMTRAILDACLHYDWPGNVRELQNFVKRWLIFNNESQALSDLRGRSELRPQVALAGTPLVPGGLKSQLGGIKKEAEKRAIIHALELSKGSRKDTARMLNISTRSLLYKMVDYEIDRRTGAAVDNPGAMAHTGRSPHAAGSDQEDSVSGASSCPAPPVNSPLLTDEQLWPHA
jgi:two-component system, NtrC family, response regulator AtoC